MQSLIELLSHDCPTCREIMHDAVTAVSKPGMSNDALAEAIAKYLKNRQVTIKNRLNEIDLEQHKAKCDADAAAIKEDGGKSYYFKPSYRNEVMPASDLELRSIENLVDFEYGDYE